jgi:N-acyl amino acid synthase of PEP-CTERM/exosortase system
LDVLEAHRARACEVSRLAVYKGFRRRPGEHATRFGLVDAPDVSPQERRTFPLIAVAAYLSANAVADLLGVERLYAMMEPFLPKLMKRSAGINFTRVGEDIDYHGLRAPYITAPEQVVSDLLPDLRALYDAIRAGFAPSIAEPSRQRVAGQSVFSGLGRAVAAGGR